MPPSPESPPEISTDIKRILVTLPPAAATASTSLKESSKMIQEKAASLGLRYSKSAMGFIKEQKEG